MAQEVVSIKGTRQGLVIRVDTGADFEVIKAGLLAKMQTAQGFFKGARFRLHWNSTDADPQRQEELELICQQYGMLPVGKNPTKAREQVEIPSALPLSRSAAATIFHPATLRNGQEITAAGNVVVMGDINPGGQVRAGGSVIVAGSVKGTVVAGMENNYTAIIMAFAFRPVDLSIAGYHASLPLDVQATTVPLVAHLRNDQVAVASSPYTLPREAGMGKANHHPS